MASVPSTFRGILDAVLDAASDVLDGERIAPATPMMEAGIDSVAAGQFADTVLAKVGIAIEPTVMFEHPTAEALAIHLAERKGLCTPSANVVLQESSGVISHSLRIGAMAQRWPGSSSRVKLLCALLQAGGDALGSPPPQRWVLEQAVDVRTLSKGQLTCIRHGGYVEAELFDSAAFHLSHAEVSWMDPQQRLLLEFGLQSLHARGMQRQELLGSGVGHFLGMSKADWSRHQYAKRGGYANYSVYATTCDSNTVASGRLSFVLGMHGPCMTLDTACSSALVALQTARLSIHHHECEEAAVTAVRLELTLQHTLDAAFASMLSINGRCFTLDRRADGYVSSEGVCAAVVCALSHLPDASPLAANFERGAVRCDGRSASLTAPNGTAQAAMIGGTNAAASPLACVELHGTGTALGDPTELSALASAQAHIENPSTAMAVGGVKASFGHTMAVSGLAGVCKVLQQGSGAGTMPNTLLRVLNQLVTSSVRRLRTPPRLVTQITHSTQTRSGVSSFGYSGTIAHVVMSHLDASPATLPLRGHKRLDYRRVRCPWVEHKATNASSARMASPGTQLRLALYSVCWERVENDSNATESIGAAQQWYVLATRSAPLLPAAGCAVIGNVPGSLTPLLSAKHDVAVLLQPDDGINPSHLSACLIVQLVRNRRSHQGGCRPP